MDSTVAGLFVDRELNMGWECVGSLGHGGMSVNKGILSDESTRRIILENKDRTIAGSSEKRVFLVCAGNDGEAAGTFVTTPIWRWDDVPDGSRLDDVIQTCIDLPAKEDNQVSTILNNVERDM